MLGERLSKNCYVSDTAPLNILKMTALFLEVSCIIGNVILGVLIPLFGTAAGSSLVLFIKKKPDEKLHQSLCGAAAGIMVAASIWSLIIPSVEHSEHLGKLSFLPACIGFSLGIFFMCLVETATKKIENKVAGDKFLNIERKNLLSYFAVTLHNFPEGLAVGMVFVCAAEDYERLLPAATALSVGIALQNIPEGAIVSLPLYSSGIKKGRALLYGILSGVVEPIAAACVFFMSSLVQSVIAYLLSFAAGTMMYVVVLQLIDDMKDEKGYAAGIFSFTAGFCLMMSLDIALG